MNKNNETCQDRKKTYCNPYLINFFKKIYCNPYLINFLKKSFVFILLAIICFLSLNPPRVLIKNQFINTILISFIVGGTMYYFDLYFLFCVSYDKEIGKSKKKQFCLFTIIYIIILIAFNVFFIVDSNIINLKSIEDKFGQVQIIKLFVIMSLDLIMITSLFIFYFYYCFKEVKKFRILLLEKFLRSELVAVTGWLLIATNIGTIITSCYRIDKLLVTLYITVAAPITLLYPFFDVFEFTYTQLNEIEKEQIKETKRKRIENESNGSKNYTA